MLRGCFVRGVERKNEGGKEKWTWNRWNRGMERRRGIEEIETNREAWKEGKEVG